MTTRIWRIMVTLFVLLSLTLNIYLLFLLSNAQKDLVDAIVVARNSLTIMNQQSVEISVKVDQEIPINTLIPISQTITVPIDLDYPLSTVVNTSFNIPVLGRQEISIPIETVVPLHTYLNIPFNETVHISITYPLHLDFPVTVDIPDDLLTVLDQSLEDISTSFK